MYLVVIVVYFIAMLAVGAVFSKRVKSDSDYFLAKDKLNAPAIGFSFSATQMSGSTYMGTAGTIRNMGMAFLPSSLSSAAAPWFCYVLVGDRVRKVASRLKTVTMSDVFEHRYGKSAGLSSTIIMLVATVPVIAAQLKAAANSFEVLLGMPYIVGLFVFGSIVVLYTMLGGMFAVAWTDLVQGLLMMVGMAIMVPVVLHHTNGFTNMMNAYAEFNPTGVSYTGSQSVMWVVSGFLVWGFFQIGGQPAAITRFLTTSSEKVIKKALVYSIIFESFIFLTVSIVAIGSGVLIDELPSTDMALPILIQMYVPPLIGGLILSAALGAMMSTVDSVLLMVSSLFVNNIYVKVMGKQDNTKETLWAGRIITIVVGVLGLLVAIDPPDAVLWIITMGFSLMASAFTFPLLLGLWWPKASKSAGLAGILAGAGGCILWYVLCYIEYQSLSTYLFGIWPAILGAAVSLVVTIVVSLAHPKPLEPEIAEAFFAD